MKETIDVSVVVPVYKVEKYLDKCIKSLIKQTHSNIEIILVDDGSPDNCGKICDQYSIKDNRIKVIHKENGGLSEARNFGLDSAKGKYVLFVDSDDYIEEDAVEKLFKYSEKNNLEVLCGNAYQINGQDKKIIKAGNSGAIIKNGVDFFVENISDNSYIAAVWLRLYNTSFLKANKMYFEVGLLHEDEQWTPYTLLAASRVGYVDYTFYNYIIRDGSITQSQDREKHIEDVIATCNELVEYINQSNYTRKQRKLIKDYYARLYMHTVCYGRYEKKKYATKINRFFPLRNSTKFKTKLKSIVYLISPSLYRSILNKL